MRRPAACPRDHHRRAAANPGFPLDLLVREFLREQGPPGAQGGTELDLHTVFSWSYRGLTEEAARLFALLTVHPGPEISSAAAISMSGLDPQHARIVLSQLVEANMLRANRPDRFQYHDLVRDYALSLPCDPDSDARARLVNHYVQSMKAAVHSFGQPSVAVVEPTTTGVVPETFASSRDATRWYVEERHVLHSIAHLAVELGDHCSALELMLDWRPMSQAVDARHDMLPFAELAVHAAERVDDPALQGEAYRDAASNFARTGQADRARTYFTEAAIVLRKSGDAAGAAAVDRSMALTLPIIPSNASSCSNSHWRPPVSSTSPHCWRPHYTRSGWACSGPAGSMRP